MLVDADYSQIELRVLAHIAHDENMIKAFQDKADIHTITASQVFKNAPGDGDPLDEKSGQGREFRNRLRHRRVFLVQGYQRFPKEAQQYIDDYLSLYSGVDRYMKEVVEKAKEDGYVETLFHRRRYLPELTASISICGPSGSGWPEICPFRAPPRISSRSPWSGWTGG